MSDENYFGGYHPGRHIACGVCEFSDDEMEYLAELEEIESQPEIENEPADWRDDPTDDVLEMQRPRPRHVQQWLMFTSEK